MIYFFIALWWIGGAFAIWLHKVPAGQRQAWLSDFLGKVVVGVFLSGILFLALLFMMAPGPALLSSNIGLVVLILLLEGKK